MGTPVMILYYGADREMLNALHVYEKQRNAIKIFEQLVENELKHLVFMMPIDEQVVISTTFRFESDMCRRIITRNYEFAAKRYLVQYMKENSEREFQEKKANRYQLAMKFCGDYHEAYCSEDTYKKVNGLWMQTIHKNESVGVNSRALFAKVLKQIGKTRNIPLNIINEILKIIDDISDEVFLWEVVEHELLRHGISPKVIGLLEIRREMNKSYLNAFRNQNIQIPYNSVVNFDRVGQGSAYDMWKISAIFRTLEIEHLINMASATMIIKLHESQAIQEVLEIIRNGIERGEKTQYICKKVRKKTDLKILIHKVLNSRGSTEMEHIDYEGLQENTLKLLHLSDLHLTDKKSMESSYFYLRLDLQNRLKLSALDYMIISGDVCDVPNKEQYEIALQFVKDLVSEFKLDLKKVVIVTGNHDCDRNISEKAFDKKSKLFREEERKQRFETYNKYFYFPLFKREFSIEYDQQIERCIDEECKIYIAGFNSSYNIDHIEREKSGIYVGAIQNDEIGFSISDDYIKLLTWHHPISGDGSIKDKTFLDTFVALFYKACFHGHIHEATKESYGYDDTHALKMIGAGSLGALQKDRDDGIPLQYNLVEIDTIQRKLIVHTRKREKENGIWMADARWGDKNQNPKAFYIVEV